MESKTKISDDYARDSYIYAFSMDEAYKYLYNTTLKHNIPLNEFQLMKVLADDTYRDHPTINNDTLHLMGWLDVGAEPMIVTVPDFDEGRYWILQTMDLGHYTDSMFGSRTRGTKGGKFMYVPEKWDGETPAGIDEVVRTQSDIVKIMGRIMAIDNPDDLKKAQAIQAQWKLQSLSDYNGTEAPAPIKRNYPVPENTNWLERVNFVLCNGNMAEADSKWLAKYKEIGLGPCNTTFSSEQIAAAKVGEELGMAHLKKIAPDMKDASKLLGTRKQLEDGQRDLFAEGTYLGQWGLPPEESMYFQMRKDSNNENITGANGNKYEIKLKAPDVSQFWSYTVYRDDNRFMAHNAINRHSRGDRTLKVGDDGYYTIELSSDVEGNADNPNFLPIPETDSYLILRLYGPDKEILEGKYKPSPVVRVN